MTTIRTVAIIGASANEARPSYFVMKYLLNKGFEVTPVNRALLPYKIHKLVRETY